MTMTPSRPEPAAWLAIDVGTARARVAYACAHTAEPRVLPIGVDGAAHVPSLIYLGLNDEFLFGDAAADMLPIDPAGVVPIPARRLDGRLRRANGPSLPAREAHARFLGHLIGLAEVRLGLPSDDHSAGLVLTHPSRCGPDDLDLLRDAAAQAGRANPVLVDEATAIAADGRARLPDVAGVPVLVLDIGRTVQWASMAAPREDRHSPPLALHDAGPHLSADLVDRACCELALAHSGAATAQADEQALLRRVVRLKETLSAMPERRSASVLVGGRTIALPTAELVEAAQRSFLAPALRALDEWLDTSGLRNEGERIPVLLCGGSAALPRLRTRLEAMGLQILNDEASLLEPAVGALRGIRVAQPTVAGCIHAREFVAVSSAFLADDHARAWRLAAPLASSGYAPAQSVIGVMHARGLGTPPDLISAAHWLQLAARQDYPTAQRELALLLMRGETLARDEVRATALLEKAASHGDPPARELLTKLRPADSKSGKNTIR